MYADTSVRFQRPISDIPIFQYGHGVVTFGPLSTSPIHAFTHDGMLQYFGVTRKEVTNATIAIGGVNVWLDEPETIATALLPMRDAQVCSHRQG